jgi:type IV secretory pathway TraG/TraD family ATPase VirD4
LALLPTDGPDFSAYDWASQGANRTGHIFLASSRNNWVAQQDLQSLMLDLLFTNIQTYPGPGCMFLDEMGIFKSEELEPALSIQRDSGVPIFLAFQNFSQLEENYGQARKWSILSNPETLVILRIRGKDAETASDLISHGSEVERPRESRSIDSQSRESRTYSTDRPTVKPVPTCAIEDRKPGAGYLVRPGQITPIQLKHRPALCNQPGFVPREWPAYVFA